MNSAAEGSIVRRPFQNSSESLITLIVE
jgi:hypothetical protein